MKKIAGITIIALLISFSINAQKGKKQQRKGSDFTVEQKATLGTKKMALSLDLTDAQQKQVFSLLKENIADREKQRDEFKAQKEEGVETTSEQKYAMQINRLEKQLEHKAAMKDILSKDQYEKWSVLMEKKMNQGKKKMAQRGEGNKKGSSNGRK